MKASVLFSLFFCLILILTNCSSSQKTSNASPLTSFEQVWIFQNGKEIPIKGQRDKITIERSAFSIRFFNQQYQPASDEFYAAQIKSLLLADGLDEVNVGMMIDDTPHFRPGTGMACNRSGKYEYIFFKEIGHHYLMYGDENSRRLNLLSQTGKQLKLEFDISQFNIKGDIIPVTDSTMDEIYFSILLDRNLNGTIDKGELTQLTVQFK